MHSDLITSAQLIFMLPLIGFVILALFHKMLPRHGDFLATGIMAFAFLCACKIMLAARFPDETLLVRWNRPWLPMSGSRTLEVGILIDGLTAIMLFVVTLVSTLVHLFSMKYMEGDVRYGRYYASLLLFTTSMLGLVLADSILFLFIFWELVGLSSYVLIGHWYEKKSASNAAIKAFITTRVGDVGMLIGMLIIYYEVGSFNFVDIFAACTQGHPMGEMVGLPFGMHASWQTLAGIGLFLGAMGKSAQFLFHVWLPDAMEGPTPVSAMIHAATMVAAGVYLVGRMFPIFTPESFIFIAYIGAITSLFAATIAVVQDDIKKVLAYSTLSQLGYMMLGLGVGGYVLMGYYAGLYHMVTHAFFKAGLFLGSGAVIHAMHHEQSLSKYGGLRHKLPITHATYGICVLAIIGFPMISGFFSKDAILGAALQFLFDQPQHWLLAFCCYVTVFLTAFYMFRQFFLTFYGKPRDEHAYDHAHESPWQMTVPLMILAFLAVFPLGFGTGWFERVSPPPDREGILRAYADFHEHEHTSVGNEYTVAAIAALGHGDHGHDSHGQDSHGDDAHGAAHGHDAHGDDHAHEGHHGVGHMAHWGGMVLSILLAALGFGTAYAAYIGKNGVPVINPALVARRFAFFNFILNKKYYFDEVYNFVFLEGSHLIARTMAIFDRIIIDNTVIFMGWLHRRVSFFTGVVLDNFFVDSLGVEGSARFAGFLGHRLADAQTGRVRNYLLGVTVGVIFISAIIYLA